MDVPEHYLSSGLPSRRPLYEYPGSSHRPLRMYPNFTYQVAYHPVGHLISTPGGAPVIRIPESSSRPPWMYRNFTYPVAYHPVGHLISTWGSSIRQVCKWTENLLHRKLRFLDIRASFTCTASATGLPSPPCQRREGCRLPQEACNS